MTLYNKYRPHNFDEVCGQEVIVRSLRNQIQTNNVSHAYLFQGLRGSGKTTLARIFAKSVNCEHPVNGNPCEKCARCTIEGVNPDLIEIDAASNNDINNIRDLIDEVKYKPIYCRYKVYIIDEAHMLSKQAFNVLLKTLEEPPEHAIFILCTTDFNKVPPTIKSRCQQFTFKFIPITVIKERLKFIIDNEHASFLDSDDVLTYIATKAGGSMRDALSLLDLCISQYIDKPDEKVTINDVRKAFGDIGPEVTNDFVHAVERYDLYTALKILQKQYEDGIDLKGFVQSAYNYFYKKAVANFNDNPGGIDERYSRILGELLASIDYAPNPLTMCQVAVLKLCKPESETDYRSVIQRMNNLEAEITMLRASKEVKVSENVNANPSQICYDNNQNIVNYAIDLF